MVSVLFVCMGNICRSPAGEGIMAHLAKHDDSCSGLRVDSCGLGGWHAGQLADPRMRDTARLRGIELESIARKFCMKDFADFDYILVAEKEMIEHLHAIAENSEDKEKVQLMTKHSTLFKDTDVPDPYYGGESGFDHVLDILEDSCAGWLRQMYGENIEIPR